MGEVNGEFPTVIGADARFKGELSFEKGVRVEGHFDGQIRSKGTLHVAEGAKIAASIEASNVRVEGECKGNFVVTEKLHLMATAKVEGDLRTNRLEIADGAIFAGNVIVGQAAAESTRRAAPSASAGAGPSASPAGPSASPSEPARMPAHPSTGVIPPRPRPQEIRIPG